MNWVIPRLCRGDSSSLTFTAVFPHSVAFSLGEVGSLRVYQDNQIEAGNSANWSGCKGREDKLD